MAPVSVSFHLLIEDQGLGSSALLVPLDSNWLMLRPWAMSFFQKLCPAPFPSVTASPSRGAIYCFGDLTVKHLPTMWETWVQSLGQDDPLEKGMATHSTILAWRIPWMEEPGRLESDMTEQLHFTYILFQVRFL